MHDTLDERLAQLGGSLESAVDIRPPSAVRSRGEQIRLAHRRRVVAVTATSAAVVMVGVGSLVAFGPGDGHRGSTVRPGPGGLSTTSAPFRTPPSNANSPSKAAPPAGTTPTASATVTVVVDLKQDTMTVRDKSGQIVKTFAVSGGKPTSPSKVGSYTVMAKKARMILSSANVGVPSSAISAFDLPVNWAIELDAGGPSLYAAPWAVSTDLGKASTTHGDIGLSDESAQWLYNYLTVGDRVQIR